MNPLRTLAPVSSVKTNLVPEWCCHRMQTGQLIRVFFLVFFALRNRRTQGLSRPRFAKSEFKSESSRGARMEHFFFTPLQRWSKLIACLLAHQGARAHGNSASLVPTKPFGNSSKTHFINPISLSLVELSADAQSSA